jgi:hypothetical protein
MAMQLAPIPPRKVEFTPAACLEVVIAWLLKDRGLKPAKAEVILVEGVPWLSFEGLVSKYEPSEIQDARLLSPLARRPPSAHNPRLADEILIIQIHDSDPTPRAYTEKTADLTATVTETHEPWATVAIVRGKDRLEIKDFQTVFPRWGLNAVWPFAKRRYDIAPRPSADWSRSG